MKRLNQESTIIFCRLLEILGDHVWMNLVVTNVLPLTIHKVKVFVNTAKGTAMLVRLVQQREQKGIEKGKTTFLRCPEIHFLVIDQRSDVAKNEILIYPQFFAKDTGIKLVKEAIKLRPNGVVEDVDSQFQPRLCEIAESWLSLLKKEGFYGLSDGGCHP